MTKGEDVSSNRKHNTERNKNDPGTRKDYTNEETDDKNDDTGIHYDEGKKRCANENSVL